MNDAPPNLRPDPTHLAHVAEMERVRKSLAVSNEKRSHVEQPPVCFNDALTFRLRRYANTNFQGLWQLHVMDKNGKMVEKLVDGDSLTNALARINDVMEELGF